MELIASQDVSGTVAVRPERRRPAASGFLVTPGFVILVIVPIVQVESRFVFALKISTVVLLTNAVGLAIYLTRRRKG